MNIKHICLATVFLIPAAHAADKQPMDGMSMDHKGTNMQTDQQAAGQAATATGTVKKVNLEKGSVIIAHGPVEALGWPSMTMGFKATPDQLRTLRQGDQVEFDFVSKGMNAVVTRIDKR